MYREIPLDLLIRNTKTPNRISRMFSKKLGHDIERIGQYETLTVRPHPVRNGYFEVLNGNARLEVLLELGASTAKCDVWEIDDLESKLFIATLNRIQGSEAPELRMNLLLELLKDVSKEELAACIPETTGSLSQLEQLERVLREAAL